MSNFITGLVCGIILVLVLTRVADFFSVVSVWRRVLMSGAQVSVMSIVAMRMRGCPAPFLIDAYGAFVHSGQSVEFWQVEACYLSRKHEVSENNIGAFIDMVKEFVKKHDEAKSGIGGTRE